MISSIPRDVMRSMFTILRIFLIYQPRRVFSLLSTAIFLVRLALLARYAYFFTMGEGAARVQLAVVGLALSSSAYLMSLLNLRSESMVRS